MTLKWGKIKFNTRSEWKKANRLISMGWRMGVVSGTNYESFHIWDAVRQRVWMKWTWQMGSKVARRQGLTGSTSGVMASLVTLSQ